MFKIFIYLAFMFAGSVSAKQGQVDPTKPLSVLAVKSQTQATTTDIVLQSIIKDKQSSSKKAIISGQLLQVGERYKSYKVIAINDKSVELQSPDRKRTLTLLSNTIVNYKNK